MRRSLQWAIRVLLYSSHERSRWSQSFYCSYLRAKLFSQHCRQARVAAAWASPDHILRPSQELVPLRAAYAACLVGSSEATESQYSLLGWHSWVRAVISARLPSSQAPWVVDVAAQILSNYAAFSSSCAQPFRGSVTGPDSVSFGCVLAKIRLHAASKYCGFFSVGLLAWIAAT